MILNLILNLILNPLASFQDAGTAGETFEYAAREAAAHDLGNFVGGATVIITAPGGGADPDPHPHLTR
jgi:hypothetical protein